VRGLEVAGGRRLRQQFSRGDAGARRRAELLEELRVRGALPKAFCCCSSSKAPRLCAKTVNDLASSGGAGARRRAELLEELRVRGALPKAFCRCSSSKPPRLCAKTVHDLKGAEQLVLRTNARFVPATPRPRAKTVHDMSRSSADCLAHECPVRPRDSAPPRENCSRSGE
jgi:hypothetical protein